MIAHGAKHSRLQIPKGHVVRKAAGVDLGVVVAARIAATDEHSVSPVAPHVRQRHRLVVKQQVRDCPRHPRIKARRRRAGNTIGLLPSVHVAMPGYPLKSPSSSRRRVTPTGNSQIPAQKRASTSPSELRHPMRCGGSECDQRSDSERCFGCCAGRSD
jgi:hypothetical protein